MKISTRQRYGLQAMIELARDYEEGYVPLRKIAAKQEISLKYLEQVFFPLKRKGLVVSERGARGGYRLSRKPAQISVMDIMDAFNGMDSPNGLDKNKTNDGKWGRVLDDFIKEALWDVVRTDLEEIAKRATLESFI